MVSITLETAKMIESHVSYCSDYETVGTRGLIIQTIGNCDNSTVRIIQTGLIVRIHDATVKIDEKSAVCHIFNENCPFEGVFIDIRGIE